MVGNVENNLEKEVPKISIKEFVKAKEVNAIRDYVDQTSFNQILNDLDDLDELEVVLFFRFLKTEAASELFSHLSEEMQQSIIQNLTKKEITNIVNELYTDEIADLLEALPPDMAKTILLSVDKTTRIKINHLLQFKDNEVGSIMSVDMILLNGDLSNKEALQLIKSKREQAEIGQYFYVVDKKNHLLGSTTLEEIVFSPKEHLISEKVKKVTPLYTKQSKEEAAIIFSHEDFPILPVLSDSGVVMGVLTSDDVIDILTEEATEDLYKASGISMPHQSLSYLKTPIMTIVKSRMLWLIILMISSTFSQILIQFLSTNFENQVAASAGISTVILIALIPVTSATSGNAGAQSTSTLTRAISMGEIKENKVKNVIFKETTVGLVLGLFLAVSNFARLAVYYSISQDLITNTKYILLISLASSISLFVSIPLSKLLGTCIFVIGIKAKKDPTVMASPLLTTVIDGVSTAVFFGFSYALIIPFV